MHQHGFDVAGSGCPHFLHQGRPGRLGFAPRMRSFPADAFRRGSGQGLDDGSGTTLPGLASALSPSGRESRRDNILPKHAEISCNDR
jgi:hypothetical protein